MVWDWPLTFTNQKVKHNTRVMQTNWLERRGIALESRCQADWGCSPGLISNLNLSIQLTPGLCEHLHTRLIHTNKHYIHVTCLLTATIVTSSVQHNWNPGCIYKMYLHHLKITGVLVLLYPRQYQYIHEYNRKWGGLIWSLTCISVYRPWTISNFFAVPTYPDLHMTLGVRGDLT